MAGSGDAKATEKTPLITPPAKVVLDDETSATLRDRVTVRRTGTHLGSSAREEETARVSAAQLVQAD